MKKSLVTIMLLALTIAAEGQAETIDTARFVAVYDYECRTLDDEEAPVTDRMQVVVQVGEAVTKSIPYSLYPRTDEKTKADAVAGFQEAYMHMPTVWIGLPDGKTTVREYIFPHVFEGSEETPEISWTLTEDTLTLSGYLCQQASATYRGVAWHVYYTEEIPSSAGPWRLRGLPGLIVKAESDAHTFRLAELRREASPITAPEKSPDVQRMKYAKLLKHKNEIYGNRQYAKNPTYYVSDLMHSITDIFVFKHNDQQLVFANGGHPLLTKAHAYKPLESE
ncbi:MAG: GLPGLI family protein [Bacteroidaceae bacterium]|nr:GLPGLI family protein [Prevotellaceae bacterium]MDY5632280.1 GLPGLI family protein [Bacteroidaceae bacterium]